MPQKNSGFGIEFYNYFNRGYKVMLVNKNIINDAQTTFRIKKTSFLLFCFLMVFCFILSGNVLADKIIEDDANSGVELKKKKDDIKKALDAWHKNNVKDYKFEWAIMLDPFKVIADVERASSAGDLEKKDIEVDDRAADRPGLTALERQDLTQLTLRAIILSQVEKESVALVEDGANIGYVVRVGTKIGRNEGYVQEILKEKIIVYEPIGNVITNSDYRLSELRLQTVVLTDDSTGSFQVSSSKENVAPRLNEPQNNKDGMPPIN